MTSTDVSEQVVPKGNQQQQQDEDDVVPLVVQDLRRFLSRQTGDDEVGLVNTSTTTTTSLFDKSATAVPVAAIKALLGVVQRSRAETMMGLQDELKQAADSIVDSHLHPHNSNHNNSSSHHHHKYPATVTTTRSHIALQSGCELFLKYVTRTFLELPNFEECRQAVLERGERFQMISLAARDRIAHTAADFVQAGSTILTHGWSRVVAAILLEASQTKHFDVIILEGRPDASGAKAAVCYCEEANIPVTVVLDAAMGYVMERVDMVLIGAEGVVENGGIVNKVGTYALAVCAQASGKPVYVAAESYKFARLYPLHQSDLAAPPADDNEEEEDETPTTTTSRRILPFEFIDTTNKSSLSNHKGQQPEEHMTVQLPESIHVENPHVDFTPARFITLLFTDLGVLTPSAVSDELIRLYQ